MGGSTTVQTGGKRLAWDAFKHGQQIRGMGLTPVPFRFLGGATTFTRDIFISRTYALVGEYQVVGCVATSDTAISAHGSNGWRFQVRNAGDDGADTDDLSASGFSSLVPGIVAGTPFRIPIEGPENASPKKVYVGEGEVLRIVGTKLASGATLATANVAGILYLVSSPPGKSGTP